MDRFRKTKDAYLKGSVPELKVETCSSCGKKPGTTPHCKACFTHNLESGIIPALGTSFILPSLV